MAKKQSNFTFGTDGFQLLNGDIYVGGFCAHKNGIVWREGPGVYITKDNQIYEGTWENDKFNGEEVKIIYNDKTEYNGSVLDGKYNEEGTYTFLEHGMRVNLKFENNELCGETTLIDPEGFEWKGERDENQILFRPQNHFYDHLTYDKGLGEEKIREQPYEDDSLSKIEEPSILKLQRESLDKLDRKSLKFGRDSQSRVETDTLSNVESDSLSKLEREFVTFRRPEVPKTESSESASSSDGSKKFPLANKKISILTVEKPNLYETYISAEYRNYCKPVKVIYPASETDT